jgi:ribose-phosphate pyrophosphokinase
MTRFSDKEIFVEIDENVRGEDVFLIQSTSFPANDNLMELLVAIDALKRGSAARITAVLPYFGYARQDRKTGPRTPISAKLVANLITTAGADRVLTMDLHAGQIQGFFDIPLDNLYASRLFINDIKENLNNDKLVFVSPDVGGVLRARSFAKKLNADLAIIDKRRDAPGVSNAMNVIGTVKDKKCIIVDDLVDSGGTICNAAIALLDNGATSVYGYCSHGVYSGKALDNINNSVLKEMVCTDSIKPTFKVPECMRYITVAPLFGEAIMRINTESSISSLFD